MFKCSVASAERGEPLFGTASRVDRWLLLEQPGPWGEEGFPSSRLDPAVAVGFRAEAQRFGARALLVRRPGRSESHDPAERTVFFVDSRPGRSLKVLRRSVSDLRELSAFPRDGWDDTDQGPLFLVCAHGKHDVCCALQGRPVAAALQRLEPDRTWEVSHVGGDRFAANMLVLPWGLYYGRMTADRAADLVAATRRGEVLVDVLRGRSTAPPAVQAAQHYARLETGLTGVDDLLPVAPPEPGPGDTTTVHLAGTAPGEQWRAVVQRSAGHEGEEPVLLTCRALRAAVPPAWSLVSLDRVVDEDRLAG